jgi:hypothetical protein
MGAGEEKLIAQQVGEQGAVFDLDSVGVAVDGQ